MVSRQRKRKNKNKHNEYYPVYKGRVNQPTIFSSSGDAHPRVTGCNADFRGCVTIEEAREFMKIRGVTEPKRREQARQLHYRTS
ncbi:conserved hypothetical protein [Histoplasma capsulatum var. duboisii H88]|uniref:Uncharacterized protein n=2 Tax=Ajellomyces capsulatus TaxID=5037 RepID=F0UD22_AJEC8|nr:conserved hypothetical protein [Histoplasma capsulatum H143]EGC43448.1 conserved hypothetical protein [Histoplasma capsulatum var. duboisii H88]